jgi:sialic acid synthase SpsE
MDPVGFSDHTMGIGAAVALGATVIEKHFPLHRANGGVDQDMKAGDVLIEQNLRLLDRGMDWHLNILIGCWENCAAGY